MALDSTALPVVFPETPGQSLAIREEDLSCNREAWKFDKACSICQAGFGVLQHKYRCKFCYRGVCGKCSKATLLHPEFGVQKRCCTVCYEKFTQLSAREELGGIANQPQSPVIHKERKQELLQDVEEQPRPQVAEGVQESIAHPVVYEEYVPLETPGQPITIRVEDLSSNREAWKFDKACSVCSVGFGVLQHRHYCKFCYRGVCGKCSKATLLHPELETQKRCCSACYEKFTQSIIRKELDGIISQSQAQVVHIERRLTMTQDLRAEADEQARRLSSEGNRLKLKQTKLDSELEKVIGMLLIRLQKAKNRASAIEQEREKVKERITKVGKTIEDKKREIRLVAELIEESQAVVSRHKSNLARLQDDESAYIRMLADRTQSLESSLQDKKHLQASLLTLEAKCRELETANSSLSADIVNTEIVMIQKTTEFAKAKMLANERKPGTPAVELITRSVSESGESGFWEEEVGRNWYSKLKRENEDLKRRLKSLEEKPTDGLAFVIKTNREEEKTRDFPSNIHDPAQLAQPRACGCSVF